MVQIPEKIGHTKAQKKPLICNIQGCAVSSPKKQFINSTIEPITDTTNLLA